jgi:hypothetical protein
VSVYQGLPHEDKSTFIPVYVISEEKREPYKKRDQEQAKENAPVGHRFQIRQFKIQDIS